MFELFLEDYDLLESIQIESKVKEKYYDNQDFLTHPNRERQIIKEPNRNNKKQNNKNNQMKNKSSRE